MNTKSKLVDVFSAHQLQEMFAEAELERVGLNILLFYSLPLERGSHQHYTGMSARMYA